MALNAVEAAKGEWWVVQISWQSLPFLIKEVGGSGDEYKTRLLNNALLISVFYVGVCHYFF